jgi:outer membrane protein OmpA-like peptidoglycan-associated protein
MAAGNVDPALKMDPDDFKLFPYQRLSGSQNMGTFVTGKINVGANGQSASDVDILLINDKGDVVAKTKSNANGTYAFKNLKAENYQAVIDNPDPNIRATMNVANTDPSLKLSPTDFQKYNYSQLGANKSASNLVVGKISMNGMNKNAQDVDVLLVNDKGEVVGQTKTNKNGSFSFKNLAAENYQVLVDNPDPNIKASVNIVNNDPSLKVSADEFKKFNFNKLSKDGAANNILLGKVNVGTSGKNPQDVGILLLNDNGEVVGRTVAGKDGSFAFKNLKAEGYQAVIEGGNAQISADLKAVNNDPALKVSGDSFKGFNFKALGTENTSQAMVVGSVNLNGVNLDGKDVGVLLLDENGNVVARTVVSKNGTFAFNKIKPGNYQAVLDTDNPNLKSSMGVPVIDPDLKLNPNDIYKYNAITKQEEKLTSADKIVLSGVLRSTDGKQSTGDGAVLLINDKGEIVKETKANKDGTFNFHNLPAGNYQVVYQSPDGHTLNPKMNIFQDDPAKRTYPDLPGKVTNTHYFGPNEYKVNDKYKEELDKFVKYYKSHPNVKGIALNAYGDFSGSADYNLELTKKRAEEARKYLQSQGIPSDKLVVNPMGRSLRFSNKYNQADPKLNRKLDIHVIE